MSKRQITLAELEEELRVGTVDLTQLEVVDVLSVPHQGLASPELEASTAPIALPTDDPGLFLIVPQADKLLANLAVQADKAVATIPPDLRASIAVTVADGEEIEDAPAAESPLDLLQIQQPWLDAPPEA